MNNIQIIEQIERLKKEKNAIILAHYYCSGEVQSIADFVGDSLALAVVAERTEADIILFCGVSFMGQTAKILNPNKTVLEADPTAGCSLADSCPEGEFAKFVENHPDHTVITYVNTTAQIKALSDICCTSSNAVKIVQSLPSHEKIIFAPDQNLGSYIMSQSGREDIVLWKGGCHVHERFSLSGIRELMVQHPEAKLLVHPECPKEIVEIAHKVGSTTQLLEFSQSDDARTFIVATESGILYNMQKEEPTKTFIAAPSNESPCNECEYMKQNSIAKVLDVLENEVNEVLLDEELRLKAERPIKRMIEISKELGLV